MLAGPVDDKRRSAPTGWRVWLLLIALLQGCASSSLAPVSAPDEARSQSTKPHRTSEQRTMPASGYYRVNRGDTLYSIAWRYGLDYRDLARWNEISSPYTIYPGHRLRLQAPPQRSVAVRAEPSSRLPSPPIDYPHDTTPSPPLPRAASPPPSAPVKAVTNKPATPSNKPAPRSVAIASGPIHWRWPTSGRLLDADSPIGEKGVKISGHYGQPVVAAAAGQVVYSGSGLIGYGKLIIIKHNETYLSAYAHNKELLVKEGDRVDGGQKIATMGMASDGRAALHFEIRHNGQPVDPLEHLPKHRG